MKTAEVVLLFHANLNHSSLSPEQRQDYLDFSMAEMLDNVEFPIALSLPAEDLFYISLHHPDTFNILSGSPATSFFLSTYAHTIADHSYGAYIEQAQLGKAILMQLIKPEMISSIAYPSEVEPPQLDDYYQLTNLWDGMILGETRIKTKSKTECLDDSFYISEGDTQKPMKAYLSRRNTQYRDTLHRYFREETSAENVVRSLLEDAAMFTQGKYPHIARIDLEAPIFNEILYENGNRTGPRLDLWKKLMFAFYESNIHFLSSKDLERTLPGDNQRAEQVLLDPKENGKWGYPEIEKIIQAVKPPVGSAEYYLWLSLHASDYLCTEQPDFVFPMSHGVIRIKKKREYRSHEFFQKLEYLLSGNLTHVTSDYVKKILELYNEGTLYE